MMNKIKQNIMIVCMAVGLGIRQDQSANALCVQRGPSMMGNYSAEVQITLRNRISIITSGDHCLNRQGITSQLPTFPSPRVYIVDQLLEATRVYFALNNRRLFQHCCSLHLYYIYSLAFNTHAVTITITICFNQSDSSTTAIVQPCLLPVNTISGVLLFASQHWAAYFGYSAAIPKQTLSITVLGVNFNSRTETSGSNQSRSTPVLPMNQIAITTQTVKQLLFKNLEERPQCLLSSNLITPASPAEHIKHNNIHAFKIIILQMFKLLSVHFMQSYLSNSHPSSTYLPKLFPSLLE